ncbi:MAG: OmpA family protein [Myxococcota bacterium]
MMSGLWLLFVVGAGAGLRSAMAGAPIGSLMVQGGLDQQEHGFGLGGAAGWAPTPNWALEAVVEGYLDSEVDVFGRGRGEARWLIGQSRWRPSALFGVGVAVRDEIIPQLSAGLALDSPAQDAIRVRTQARVLVADATRPPAWIAEVGLTWGRAPAPEKTAPEKTAPMPTPASTSQDTPPAAAVLVDLLAQLDHPDEVLVWVPHPICEWRSAAEAAELLARLPAGQSVQINVDGYLPQTLSLTDTTPIQLTPAPRQGAVVISAGAGDRVRVVLADGNQQVTLGPQGNGISTLPEGDVTVFIEGAGRTDRYDVSVFDGYGIWLQASAVRPEQIVFALGSSQLTAAARDRVSEIADQAGDWWFQLQGSSSPEGNAAANRRLAQARAASVRAALIAAGLPAERIVERPPENRTRPTTEEMRNVTITPFVPSEAE